MGLTAVLTRWNRQAATTIRATTMEPGPTGELALCHAGLEPCPELDIATVETMEQVSVLLVLMVLENLILLVATWVNAANGIGLAGQAAAKHQIARKISVCDSEVPNADPRNPFISCATIRQNNHLSYQSNAKWVDFVNPDKVTTQVLPGTVLGHKDDPNKVKTATWYNTKTTVAQTVPVAPIYTPSPTNYYFGRNQVAYNSKPYVAPTATVVATPVISAPVVAAPVVAAPVVSSYKTTVSQNPPQYIIDQAANASSKTVMSATQILGGGKIAAPVAEKKVTAVEAPAKTASTMNFLWSSPNR